MYTIMNINPTLIFQGSLSLIIAITCTDAIRDLITLCHPKSLHTAALFRAMMVVIIIALTIIVINWLSTDANIVSNMLIKPQNKEKNSGYPCPTCHRSV